MNKPLRTKYTTRQPDVKTVKNAGPFICFVATSTEEKLAHYNAIARAENIPILYLSLNTILEAFLAAPEDTGDMVENGYQKLRAIKDKVEMFQSNPAYQKIIKDICSKYGLDFNPNNILFMGEDSTFDLPKDVWDCMRPKLEPFVPEEVLDRADNHGKKTGPGAETGPIMAAVGYQKFANMIRVAALEAGYKPRDIVRLVDKVACTYYKLNEPVQLRPTLIEAAVDLHLTTRGSLKKPIELDPKTIHLTHHFLSTPSFNGTPNADKFEEFLTKHSVRRELVLKMYEKLSGLPASASRAPVILKRVKPDITKFKIAEVKTPPTRLAPTTAPARERLICAIKPVVAYERADARIFYPLTGLSAVDRKRMIVQFLATATVRDFEAAEKYKPLVVIDDGSWTETLNFLTYLANMGMAKRYVNHPYFSLSKLNLKARCEHLAFSDVDVIRKTRNTRLDDLEKAAWEVTSYKLRNYSRFSTPKPLTSLCSTGGVAPIQNLFTVGAMASASSENKVGADTLGFISTSAALRGYAISSGGGDKHLMGAFHNPYGLHNGPHSICTSTPPLVASETERGELPPCSSWSIVGDLYTRTVDIIYPCHALVNAPGGKGSSVEGGATLVLSDLLPELMPTEMIFFNADIHEPDDYGPNAFHEPFMRLFLGDRKTDRLLDSKNDGVRQKGLIHSATTKERVWALLEEIHATLPKPLTHFRLG